MNYIFIIIVIALIIFWIINDLFNFFEFFNAGICTTSDGTFGNFYDNTCYPLKNSSAPSSDSDYIPPTTRGGTGSWTNIGDNIAPTAVITYSSPGPYKQGGTNDTIIITATFSKIMKDSPIPQLAITGSGISNVNAINMTKSSETVYTYNYTVPKGNGTGTISLLTGKDLAGNLITSIPTSGKTFIVANTAPTAAITYNPSGPYTIAQSVIITATFSKSMKESPIPQLAINGSGISNVSAMNMTRTSETVYTYNYTVPNEKGIGTISLSTGEDIADNLIISIPTIGATFIVDNVNTIPLKDTTKDTCIDNIHAGTICNERHPGSNMYGLKKITKCAEGSNKSKFECENLWFNETQYNNVINTTSCINKSIDFDEACRIFQPKDNSLKTLGYNINSIGSKQILYGKNGDCYNSSGNEDFNKGRALCSYNYNTNMTKLDHIQNNYDYNVFTDCKNIKSNFNKECKTLLGKTDSDKVYAYINGFDCLPGFGRAKCIDKSEPINETGNMIKFMKDANISYFRDSL